MTSRMKYHISLPLIIVFGFLTAYSQHLSPKKNETSWEAFNSTDGGFSLLVPSQPTEQTYTITTDVGDIQLHMFASLGKEGSSYTFAFWDVPNLSNKPEQIRSGLDTARDSHVKSIKGKLLSETARSLDGFSGREVQVQTASAIVTSRIYIAKNRVYVISAWVPELLKGTEVASTNGLRFLDSFKLIRQ